MCSHAPLKNNSRAAKVSASCKAQYTRKGQLLLSRKFVRFIQEIFFCSKKNFGVLEIATFQFFWYSKGFLPTFVEWFFISQCQTSEKESVLPVKLKIFIEGGFDVLTSFFLNENLYNGGKYHSFFHRGLLKVGNIGVVGNPIDGKKSGG